MPPSVCEADLNISKDACKHLSTVSFFSNISFLFVCFRRNFSCIEAVSPPVCYEHLFVGSREFQSSLLSLQVF